MLKIKGLSKKYGSFHVLKSIDLELEKGEAGVLIGPSGTGKSTVLRCVNGLENFDDGVIHVDATELHANGKTRDRDARLKEIRKRVGMVFQSFNLFPHLSVIKNVMEAPIQVLRRDKHQALEEAEKLLDRVGLKERMHVMPHQLSGGQQQRVAIARALAMRPELILFDEPTSALDPTMTLEVLSVIRDLAFEGQTMLVVTHAMGFAKQVADKVFVAADGYIAEAGPPEEIFDAPKHPATQKFLNQVQLT